MCRSVSHGGVQHAQTRLLRAFDLLAEQDQARAAAIDGHAVQDALAQRLQHVPFHQQLADGGAFAAGDDHALKTFHVLELAHFADIGAQTAQRLSLINI